MMAIAMVSRVFGRRARQRWVHLVVGGALLMPYYFVALVVVDLIDFTSVPLVLEFTAYGVSLPMVAISGLFPVARTLEVAVARPLLGVPPDQLRSDAAASWGARVRTATWLLTHLGVGGIVSALSLAVPPMIVVLFAVPLMEVFDSFTANGVRLAFGDHQELGPVIGLGLLVALIALATGCGAGMAALAPRLLGPSTAERLVDAQRHATQLAERNRLARDLHDSVGHALSVINIQSGAARRMLDRDSEFTRQALGAVEEVAREALTDLDQVLGVLRRDANPTSVGDDGDRQADSHAERTGGGLRDGDRAPVRLLAVDLDQLLERATGAGMTVEVIRVGDLGGLPRVLSAEAYRIVQECLTNALRHAAGLSVSLRVDVNDDRLELEVSNPVAKPSRPDSATGTRASRATRASDSGGGLGRGRGVRGIEERARTLGGWVRAGRVAERWRVLVSLPRDDPGTAGR